MNEAHGQDYDAKQYVGGIDKEEIRVMVQDGLWSLRKIAVALEKLTKTSVFEHVFGKWE